MKKMIIFIVVMVLVLVFISSITAETFRASIVPADAQWVIHLDIDKFKSTRVGDMLLKEKDISGLHKINREFLKETKINLFQDISGITLYGGGKDEESTVVCLSGKFDRNYLLGLLEGEDSHRATKHGQNTIHKWDGHDFGAFARDNLVLLGKDRGMMERALDVIAGKRKNISSTPTGVYFQKTPKDVFITVAASNVSLLMEGRSKPRFLKNISSGFLTASEENTNFNLQLTVGADSQKDAANLEQVIKGFVALGKMYVEEIGDLSSLLENLTITVQKNQVQVQLIYPSDELFDILSNSGKFLLGLEGLVL